MNRDELIHHFSFKQFKGASFIDIRKEMESKDLDLELVKDVIWEIDHNIHILPKIENEYKNAKLLYIISILFLTIPSIGLIFILLSEDFELTIKGYLIIPIQLISFYAATTKLKKAKFQKQRKGL
jgi:hypothetical protein